MDFQQVVDSIDAMTCVISVEKRPDGGYGKIRIVTGNQAYLDSIEHPAPGTELLTAQFVPNSEYTDYLTRDLNFEDSCYRAAMGKKCLHAYAHPDRIDAWFNMTFLPLAYEDAQCCYCTYTMEIGFEANAARMSNVNGELASAVLETSLKLRKGDFTEDMREVLKDIRALCEAEYCCILLVRSEQHSCRVLCEDCAEDSALTRSEDMDGERFYEIAESWEDTIAGSNCLIAKNAQEMAVVRERNPRWYDSLRDAGVRTIALFPLKTRRELLGYIWASNFDPERAGRIKETLELTTFILSSEIANHLMLRQLQVLSSTDMLTGLRNRNEMKRQMERLSAPGEPIGVIFADLNGLKTVNDTEGHDAGDALLRDAASALRRVFSAQDIFRVGGDEFVVFLPGVAEEALAKKADALRAAAARYDRVSFAIGFSAAPTGADVERAVALADERMYQDKRAYYAQHPERQPR